MSDRYGWEVPISTKGVARYSLFGGDPRGDDRWPEKEDKRDLMK